MAVDREFVKQLADLTDGDGWRIADLLVAKFPPEEGDTPGVTLSGKNTGLHSELEEYETELAKEYGVELKATTMRQYRATALAWPESIRVSAASFAAHKALKGKDRQENMRMYLVKMKHEGKHALGRRTVMRYKAEDNPAGPGVPWETQVARSINSVAKRHVLGNVLTDRDDWWNAKEADATRRDIVVKALRKMASQIASAE